MRSINKPCTHGWALVSGYGCISVSGRVWRQRYGAQTEAIAAELAEHFVRGADACSAVHYLHQAAEKATQRSAHHEVTELVTRALALLRQLPERPHAPSTNSHST